jgi:hypothetical protein
VNKKEKIQIDDLQNERLEIQKQISTKRDCVEVCIMERERKKERERGREREREKERKR